MGGWHPGGPDAVSWSQSSQALCFLICFRQRPLVPVRLTHMEFLESSEKGVRSDDPSPPLFFLRDTALFLRSHEQVLSTLWAQLMWL